MNAPPRAQRLQQQLIREGVTPPYRVKPDARRWETAKPAGSLFAYALE